MSVLRITEKVSQEFLTGVGNQLNKELIAQDQKNKHTSYISGKMLYCFSLTSTLVAVGATWSILPAQQTT